MKYTEKSVQRKVSGEECHGKRRMPKKEWPGSADPGYAMRLWGHISYFLPASRSKLRF